MTVRTQDIFKAIEKVAPRSLAENWDNPGLQVGSYNKIVNKVLLTLDVTAAVIEEAIDKDVDLIVSHHPFIFKGVKSICVDDGKGASVAALIKHDISVYSAHTNLDSAQFGINYYIATSLGIKDGVPLEPSPADRLYKLVIFVPEAYTQNILDVLGEEGAGYLGKYSHSSFRAVGKSTFKPLEGATPFIGEKNKIETVSEDRIETIITYDMAKDLIPKVKSVHPYEQMAYDLYPMAENLTANKNGMGKIGDLKKEMTPDAFIALLKNKLGLTHVRTAGVPPKEIKRVALCTGAGAEFMGLAKIKHADAYITGDLKYHEAQSAVENHLWIIDAGHYGTEHQVAYLLKNIIDAHFSDIDTAVSENIRDFINIV